MSKNTVQFQKGLSLPEFLAQYGTEEQCYTALYQLRWSNGFVCPACGNPTHCQLKNRKLYQGHKCHHQTSLIAGTIFEHTKLPLTKWFLAIYLLTQHKTGLSAMQLGRDIGVSYNSAWMMKHKLMQVMLERQKKKKLSGRVEIDDAYIGGEHPGKRGRGSPNKVPFIAAVETTEDHKPIAIHLRRVKGFRTAAIAQYAHASLCPGSTVWSDGLGCFRAIEGAGCIHVPIVTGGGRSGGKHPLFKWVNTVLGNVKNAMSGTFHAFHEKHVPRYLAEFEYRFNRRFQLPAMIERLSYVALKTPPMPHRLLKLADVYA